MAATSKLSLLSSEPLNVPCAGRTLQRKLRRSSTTRAAADFYDTLGVARNADKADIKKAYRYFRIFELWVCG